MPRRSDLIRRIVDTGRTRSRGEASDVQSRERTDAVALTDRIDHLESVLEGLQDAVHRETLRQNERIAEITRRLEPHELALALGQDPKRRGFA